MSTILIIDRDAALRRIVKYLLEADGHHVLTSSNGEDGLAMIRGVRPSLLILDDELPLLDVAAMVDGATDDVRPPVLILTALPEIEARSKIELDDCIRKPFSPEHLLKTVMRLTGSG